MANITIPTLVLWGEYDGVNTIDMAYDAYNSLGTDPSEKELLILFTVNRIPTKNIIRNKIIILYNRFINKVFYINKDVISLILLQKN